ncbi:MAG: cadmium-translocating P-type ATPase [Firmicutes bacterium]|nr:cadmium-translocating P-type ATPase [Bacillota bacterium]
MAKTLAGARSRPASNAASGDGAAGPFDRKIRFHFFEQLAAMWSRHRLAAAVAGCTVFLVAGAVGNARQWPEPLVIGLYVAAYVSGGAFSLQQGLESLIKERRIDVDLLMVMAAAAAAGIGEWTEGGILLFLFSLSNALQFYAMQRTRRAITALMNMRPRHAWRKRPDGMLERVPVEDLSVGDVVVVRPGELVPIDGRIVAGTSSLDESSITGESMPKDKGAGDEVFGGTVNQYGALEVRVARAAGDTVIARIIRMVEEAQSEEAPTQQLIARIEQYYALAVIGMTLLAAVVPIALGRDPAGAVYRAITLMVVASPCAVAMAVPASVVAAIANGARSGVLFKGGIHIENMADVEVVAFDKTGTLTWGRPRVTDIIPAAGRTREEVLALAAAAEGRSEHPLAKAVLEAATGAGAHWTPADNTQAVPGKGVVAELGGESVWVGSRRLLEERVSEVPGALMQHAAALEGEGKTIMFVGRGDEVAGVAAVTDELRPNAARMIARLKRQGIRKVVLLTGDNQRVGEVVGRKAGADEVYAELLPGEKAEIIARLREEIGPVAMVGDGVNDAPALATATVGVAMGAAGSDVALETADVVLMSNDLEKINHAVALSRRAKGIIAQNLVFALGVIAVLSALVLTRGIVLAAGVVGHEGSTLLVIFNSLRLLLGQHRSGAGAATRAAGMSQ